MTPAEYRARAAECTRIAYSQQDADMRRQWLELARQWHVLATQVEEMHLGEPGHTASEKPHRPEK
jgi:hypothetical protein